LRSEADDRRFVSSTVSEVTDPPTRMLQHWSVDHAAAFLKGTARDEVLVAIGSPNNSCLF
jgi:hypothetical protein